MQEGAINPSAEMESPHDLAKQALAATGGKSTLKATKWLLDRRSGAQQQQQGPVEEGEIGSELGGPKGGEEEELESPLLPVASLLPSSSSRGNSLLAGGRGRGGGGFAELPAALGVATTIEKRVHSSLPCSMDWLVSSTLERHPSVGSCSPFDCPPSEFREAFKPEAQQSAMASKALRSEEGAKMTSKLTSVAIALQDAHHKRKRQDESDTTNVRLQSAPSPSPIAVGVKGKYLASLAERMRPTSIAEILGQEHLLGSQGVLRSLLDLESLPCIIFGGPPGTGKTSIARLIARSASCRFVALSSAMAGTTEIQEILDEANHARKFGQRTVLFVEQLSRFSKSQQECVLPAIEEGYVIFIGATVENPAAESISALLLRCHVFTLKKLQPDHLCTALERAICDKERGVLVSVGDVSGIEMVAIEDEVIQFLASAADGDARVALNALEAAVYTALGKVKARQKTEAEYKTTAPLAADEIPHKVAPEKERTTGSISVTKRDVQLNVLEHLKGHFQVSQEEYAKPFKRFVGGKQVTSGTSRDKEAQISIPGMEQEGREGGDRVDKRSAGGDFGMRSATETDIGTTLVVTMADAKEAFQWPLVVIEKLQEESEIDLITALLKSIRGGDSNAGIYWLARALEKSDGSFKVANSLLKFASEEIGMADPQALVHTVACYQACQLLGMKDCSSHLTQCVVYLSMAPKSVSMSQAFQSAQKVVQDGQNEPVPSHLRSTFASLVKESSYLPTSLRNLTFLKWPENQ